MDVHLRALAARQYDIVAAWQLMRWGWTRRMVDHGVEDRGWRVVHPGVYALTAAVLTTHQRWMAAALTAPETVLSHQSAAACWGFGRWLGMSETVTRPGNGGPRELGGVLVRRSRTLAGETTSNEGIPITTVPRTLIDRAAHMGPTATGRMLREALRLRKTTAPAVIATLANHRGQPGTPSLLQLATRYAGLPIARTRSDPEALALAILQDAGIEPPRVNMRIRGEEADLVWPKRRRIVEIDGPQFHQFRDEDARKQAIWEAAGNTVRRIASHDVYFHPRRLLVLANVPN
ncbi:MAG: hypothetical protein QOD53_1899 [Thermoleophilaceae bacterium]|nr:hypothetical protein [Thermoleophilaceae bacterium]